MVSTLRSVQWASLVLSIGVLAYGQAVSTAQIKGTVVDQTGLAIPGAEVKVTQTETALVRTTTTDAEGAYLLTSLPVGPYQLEVTKQGFSQYLQTGITLLVATNPTIEVFMDVGEETNLVEVEANASMVETLSSGVG